MAGPGDRHLLLRVAFRGTGLHGYQVQGDEPTVARALEEALRSVLDHPVALRASSRTDAGVHAAAIAVAVTTHRPIPLRGLVLGANSKLPANVRVVRAEERAKPVDPRACSKEKTYRYLVWNHPASNPFLSDLSWHVPARLDLIRLRPALEDLLGEHDFSAFRARGCQAAHPRRTITAASFERCPERPSLLRFEVRGKAFLRHQVRIIVGTLAEIARGLLPPERVAEVLESGDRTRAGKTAPAHGLFLVRVALDLEEPLDSWPGEHPDPSDWLGELA